MLNQMGDYSYVFQGSTSSSPFSPQPSQRICSNCNLRNTSVVETNYFNKRQEPLREPFREDRAVLIPSDAYHQLAPSSVSAREPFREDRPVVYAEAYQPLTSYYPRQTEPYRDEVKPSNPLLYHQRESFSEDIDKKKLEQVFTKLRKLSVPKLLETVEPVLDQDLMLKARNAKGVLKDLIPTFTNEQLFQYMHMLPKDAILKLQELNVPEEEANAFHWTFQDEKLRDGSFHFVDELKQIPKADNHFTLIDPMFAIGDIESSYAPFDVIVNLAYPTNGAKNHEINVSYSSQTKQLLITVGILDLPGEPMADLLRTLVPYLLKVTQTHYGRLRILFHCHAGISRSSTVAIAFFSKWKGYTIDTSLQFIKSKRPIIQPNDGFMMALYQFAA